MMYYYHPDHLGTPQKMTDASGVVVWSADYKPFGEATINPSSTITNNLRFPGQYYDAETGLNYNLNRTLNTAIDRYIEADPTGLLPGERSGLNHLYGYAKNNPMRFTDPFGLWACPTGRTYRACDPCGCGNYGTGRDGGARTHAGVDVCAVVNDTVSSPLAGTVESIDDGIRITGRVNGVMYSVRVMHFNSSVTSGQIAEGASLGTMSNMTSQYNCNGMTNHVHVEIYQIQGGTTTRINPTTVLPCGH
jgi:RHS repeat-associated protein